MKNIIIFSGLIVLMSCAKDTNSLCGDYLSVKLNESKTVKIGVDEQTLIQLIRLEDNRCPQDLICIRAGEVFVDLRINNDEVLNFCLGDCMNRNKGYVQADTLLASVNNEEVNVVLRAAYSDASSTGVIPPTACFEVVFNE